MEAVFKFRRKQLRAALPRVTGMPANQVAEKLSALGIDPERRAETLGLAEWEATFRLLGGLSSES